MTVDILTRLADAKAAGTMPLRPRHRRRKTETGGPQPAGITGDTGKDPYDSGSAKSGEST